MVRQALCVTGIVLFLFSHETVNAQEAAREPIQMSIVIVNPSKTKSQGIPIKMYLPQEVTPQDILDSAGLDVEFDAEKSMYYVFKESVLLRPAETRTYNVEIKDVWVIPSEEIDSLKKQTEFVVSRFEESEFYETAQKLGETISKSLETVERTQNDTTISKRRHIGVYRDNVEIVQKVKENIAMLESKLMLPKARPVPEVLEKPEVKTDAPSKTTTWLIVFLIMLFIGMLAGVFFFTWQTQAHFTKNLIANARNLVFPKRGGPPDQGKDTGDQS
jgi:hypothetical protein